jgi:hypothetical protein
VGSAFQPIAFQEPPAFQEVIGVFSEFWYADIVTSIAVSPLPQTNYPVVGRVTYIELSSCFVTATYYSTSGALFTPASVAYRVDDVHSAVNLVPWTAVVPSTSNTILITSMQNAMVSDSRRFETHQVLFQIVDSFGDIFYAAALFDLRRTTGLD